ncbi:unnamed protein product [Cercospora beticola]|nr:unnamed protein product [Cercospora beticola]
MFEKVLAFILALLLAEHGYAQGYGGPYAGTEGTCSFDLQGCSAAVDIGVIGNGCPANAPCKRNGNNCTIDGPCS